MNRKSLLFFVACSLGFATLFSGCGGTTNPPAPTEKTESFTVNDVTFTMVEVKAGTFTMGAVEGDNLALDREKPAHQVTLTHDYWLGETEVTQALWQAVMGENPSYFADKPSNPVEMVSWNDIQLFLTALNEQTGKEFRLPTEAEWEYAARGGNQSKGYLYAGSDNIKDVAWYWNSIPSQNSSEAGYGTQQVKTKQPNELGLYDMSGNVWEWCSDRYADYTADAQTDPQGATEGSNRVNRGGSWYSYAQSVRVSCRGNIAPDLRNDRIGFRLSLSSNR